MDDGRIIAYNRYCTELPARDHKSVLKKNILRSPLTLISPPSPPPQKTPVVQKESQAAENESRPKDELLTYNKQVKQVSRFSTVVR